LGIGDHRHEENGNRHEHQRVQPNEHTREAVCSLKVHHEARPEQKARCPENAKEHPMVGNQLKHIANGS
jgi:hypothetical protein